MAKYTIVTDFERPDLALVEFALSTHVSVTGTAAGPRQIVDSAIKALNPEWRICGPAFTIRPEWTDDLLLGEIAPKWVKPGDVLVIDGGGRTDLACWGAGMTRGAQRAGAAGVVVDGACTNSPVLRRLNLPVFSRGFVAGASNRNDRGGWINNPVICGGVIVYPGDLILADSDGVVVIPRDRAREIIERSASFATVTPRPDQPPRPDVPYYISRGAEAKLAAIEDLEIV